jgi:Transposase
VCAESLTFRLVPFIQPWARVTTRLFQAREDIGLATSGMLGARLGKRLGMPASWKTILRRMMARPSPPVKQVVELGIDDFSFRRGRRFGTILVDLPSHHVIDLLPDRSVETVSAWMRRHPEIRRRRVVIVEETMPLRRRLALRRPNSVQIGSI